MIHRHAQVPNIDTWQRQFRAEGLVNLHRIMPNLLVVNAQDVFPLNYQARDYDLHEIPNVARVMNHPAVSALVVITEDGDVLLEHYRNGRDRETTFSDQSSTKSMGYVLLSRALRDGKISLDDRVEKHIPDIGSGFKGRTIGDVAAMAVHHNVAELAAYTGDPAALEMFDRDERVIGLQRNDERETLRSGSSRSRPPVKTDPTSGRAKSRTMRRSIPVCWDLPSKTLQRCLWPSRFANSCTAWVAKTRCTWAPTLMGRR